MTDAEKIAVDEFDRQIKIIEDATNDKALSETGRASIVAIADSAALTAQRIASRIRALAATPAMRDALGEIASKNDLSGISDDDLASAACNALYECELIARAALAATPAVGGEALRETISNAIMKVVSNRDDLGYTHFIEIRDSIFSALAAQPASPLRGREDLAPSPCSDLSIGELIEWLDNPQWTNGYLNSDAANHMSAAAELIERLVSSAPPEQPAAAPVREIIEQCAHAAFEAYGSITSDQYALEGPAGLAKRMINAIRAISMDKQPLRYGEPVWPNNDEANDLDKGDGA